jgi:hypothetical protein
VPVMRRAGLHSGPAAAGDAAGPRLERVVPFAFTAADRTAGPRDLQAFRDHVESIHGPMDDFSWLDDGPAVTYHDMARAVARELAGELDGVDLVITVDAGPDCRHQSFPGSVLGELIPGDPLIMGVGDQGVVGPFTALRLAVDLLAAGSCRRALVLITEQSTVAPTAWAARARHDVAVALLLGPDGAMGLDRPVVTVTGRAGATPPVEMPAARTQRSADAGALVAGAGLGDLRPGPGVALARAEDGHPCAGVWLALARFLERGGPVTGQVLVADQDPVLPYLGSVLITLPAPHPAPRPAAVAAGHAHPDERGLDR